MEENKYRTSGVIDDSTYQEVGKFSLSGRYIWGTRIAALIVAALALPMLAARKHLYFVLFAACALLLLRWPRWYVKISLDAASKRMREAYPGGFMQMETWLTQEGVALHNLTDGAQLVLPYGTFLRVAETERYFYLVTKGNQFTLVFKDMLTPEQRRSFLPYLRERCPNIKVKAMR